MALLSEQDKQELKRKLPDYLKMRGIEIKGKNILCINPAHDETNPSMSYQATDHYLNCFGCGESYDIFRACEALEGLPQGQGINRIKQIYGYTDQSQPATNYTKNAVNTEPFFKKPKQEEKKPVKNYADFVLKAHESLCMHDYHAERGISEEVAARFKLGYVQDVKAWVRRLLYRCFEQMELTATN